MDPENTDWKKELDKFKVVQKCPKCGKLSLSYAEGKIKCYECNYEQNMGSIE